MLRLRRPHSGTQEHRPCPTGDGLCQILISPSFRQEGTCLTWFLSIAMDLLRLRRPPWESKNGKKESQSYSQGLRSKFRWSKRRHTDFIIRISPSSLFELGGITKTKIEKDFTKSFFLVVKLFWASSHNYVDPAFGN